MLVAESGEPVSMCFSNPHQTPSEVWDSSQLPLLHVGRGRGGLLLQAPGAAQEVELYSADAQEVRGRRGIGGDVLVAGKNWPGNEHAQSLNPGPWTREVVGTLA